MIPIYPESATSLFYAKLEAEDLNITELLEVDLPGGTYRRWTTSNQEITYTLSGTDTIYSPMLGNAPKGLEEGMDMGVSVVQFALANTGSDLRALMESDDFPNASVKIGRVFVDTPNLGRMQLYVGQMGDFSHTRNDINGELRNVWKSINIPWPYHQVREKCVWRFGSAGCGFNTSSITVTVNSIVVGSSTAINILTASGHLTRSFSNERLDFGRLTVTAGANSGHIRTIRNHSADLLYLSRPLPSSDLTGMQFTVYPGCRKRLMEDCRSYYSNDENYLGWPWIPVHEEAM